MSDDYPSLSVAQEDHARGEREREEARAQWAEWEHHAPADVHTTTCEECGASIWVDQALADGYADSGRYLALCYLCAARTKQPRWRLTPQAEDARRERCEAIKAQVKADYEQWRKDHPPTEELDLDEYLAEHDDR